MPSFVKISFKLCPWGGIEWVGRQAQAEEYKGPWYYLRSIKRDQYFENVYEKNSKKCEEPTE